MSLIRSDSRNETHNKPVQEGERKLSGGAYIDYISTAEVIAAVTIEYRKNKYFWINDVLYHCGSDGTTFRTTGLSQTDLANYTTFTDVDNKFYTYIGQQVTDTLKLETIPKASGVYGLYTGVTTATGWGFNIGTPGGFNTLKFNIKASAAITSIIAQIVDESNAAVLTTKSLTVAYTSGNNYDLTITFDTTITNAAGNKLFFQFATNGLCEVLGSILTNNYPIPNGWYNNQYKTGGAVNFSGFVNTVGSNRTIWAYINFYSVAVGPSPTFSENVANNSPSLKGLLTDTKPKVDGAIAYNPVETIIGESMAEAGALYSDTGSTFAGWGTNVGTYQNFNTIKFSIRARTTAITKVRVWLTENNKNGAVLLDMTLTVNIAPSASQYLIATFPTIANASNTPLCLFWKSDQQADRYGVLHGTFNYMLDCYTTTSQPIGTMTPTAFNDSAILANPRCDWCRFSMIVYQSTPTSIFQTNIEKNSVPIQSYVTQTKPMVDSAMTYGPVQTSIIEIFPESGATWRDQTSTFTGWGTPIGTRQNFNTVYFRVGARAGNAIPIAKIHCWITATNKTGQILGDVTITGLSIAAGTSQYITATFSSVIANASNAALCFFYQCDQLSDLYAMAPGSIVTPVAAYTTSKVVTAITPANYNDASGPQRNIWCNIILIKTTAIPTDDFKNQIIGTPTVPVTLPALITMDVVLPSLIYCIEARETNIWFYDIVFSNLKWDQFDYDITCTKGAQLHRCWRFTPTAADAGTTTITIAVSLYGTLIKSVTATLNIVALSAANGASRSIICVGDSLTAGANYISTITSEDAADVMPLTFKGTLGTAPNKHEGRGGWRMAEYAGAGRTSYIFNVAGIAQSPGIDSVYNDGASTYTVIEINITAGTGYFSCTLTTGPGTPPASGTLTKVSGTGPATINYSSTSTISGNPFWNGSAVSLTYYMNTNSITLAANDWIIIALGVNDIFSGTAATIDGIIDTYITNLRTFITAMHTGVSGIRVGIWCMIMPNYSQDGFGMNYGSGQTLAIYLNNVKKLQQRVITEFDNSTERTNLNFILPMNCVVDRDNSFAKTTVPASARETTVTVQQPSNGVHPGTSGYKQISDQMWAFLKKLA